MAEFGPFILGQAGLARDGRPVAVGQRGLALLRALAEAEGAVEKATLMQAGWPGTVVEEGNLTVQIAALRKALGPRDDGQEWIVTVPRLGYRLVRGASPASPVVEDTSSRLPTVAVLPFLNLSGGPDQDYLADGLVEEIITALSRFRRLAVIARNSSFVYKGRSVDVREVGRELGAGYVLEGSVRRLGERLRVTAQLIDASNGAHLWARNFDGTFEDIFEVQDRITREVVLLVQPQIEEAEIARARRKPPENLDAYDLILRAVPLHNSVQVEDNAECYRLLTQALALEPDNVMALSNAAWALEFRMSMGWPPLTDDDVRVTRELTERALAQNTNDATVLAQAGVTFANDFGQYERGMELARLAVEMNPNNRLVLITTAVTYLHCGDIAESLRLSHRAIELSPIDPQAHWPLTAIAHAHMARGAFEEALAWATRSFASNPNFDATHWMLIAGNAQLGRMDEARAWLARFRELRPAATIASIRHGQPARYPDRMASIYEGLRLAGLPEGDDG